MTKSPSPTDFVADLLNSVADKIEESLKNAETPKPEQKEASNTTGGTWEPAEKEASNNTGGSIPEVEIKNPISEAQRVLGRAEAVAEGLANEEVKAATLLEVAKVHTEIGKQLLLDFDF